MQCAHGHIDLVQVSLLLRRLCLQLLSVPGCTHASKCKICVWWGKGG